MTFAIVQPVKAADADDSDAEDDPGDEDHYDDEEKTKVEKIEVHLTPHLFFKHFWRSPPGVASY